MLVLRPEPGNAATTARCRARGLDPLPAPLFAIEPCTWAAPQGTAQGLLVGSAAVFAQAGPELARLRHLPVHAVGETTAAAAAAAGFAVASTGSGGLQAVVATLGPGTYWRLAGAARVPLAPPPGVIVRDCVVYAARPLPLGAEAQAVLRAQPAVVLVHSAEAAHHLRACLEREGIATDRIALACLGPRISAAAGPGWRLVAHAQRPDDEAVLSLAQQMCQTL